jgi:type I restriction enzyme S subunit
VSEDLNSRFLLEYVKREGFYKRLGEIADGGRKAKRIQPATFLSFSIYLPPSGSEQDKIAECLDSLEQVIAAQVRRLKALQQHKRGLLQRLFPREDETQPRLRFRPFRDSGQWEEKKLDDLATRGTGHTPSKSRPEYYSGGIKWVSLADSWRLDSGLINATEVEISDEGVRNSSAVLHPSGSVVLSRDAGVGKSAILGSPMAVSQHFVVWTCDAARLSNWFLYYFLQVSKPAFERVAIGNAVKTIGLPYFREMRIAIPGLAEQRRIAGCLSVLDEQIASQAQEVDALERHKRGLTQQLFPSPEGD